MRQFITCAGMPVRRSTGSGCLEHRTPAQRRTWLMLLAAALLSASACANPSDSQTVATPTASKADETLQVTVVPVSLRPTKRLLKFVGTLFGNEELTLSSQVEG